MSFLTTPPELLPVLQELIPLEPIFHTPAFGADYERTMDADYWEVGASGRRYSRAFILRAMREHPPVDAQHTGWAASGHALRQLGEDTWLLTYTLRQAERLTRRATIWRKTAAGWCILYHQGTPVTSEADDEIPA